MKKIILLNLCFLALVSCDLKTNARIVKGGSSTATPATPPVESSDETLRFESYPPSVNVAESFSVAVKATSDGSNQSGVEVNLNFYKDAACSVFTNVVTTNGTSFIQTTNDFGQAIFSGLSFTDLVDSPYFMKASGNNSTNTSCTQITVGSSQTPKIRFIQVPGSGSIGSPLGEIKVLAYKTTSPQETNRPNVAIKLAVYNSSSCSLPSITEATLNTGNNGEAVFTGVNHGRTSVQSIYVKAFDEGTVSPALETTCEKIDIGANTKLLNFEEIPSEVEKDQLFSVKVRAADANALPQNPSTLPITLFIYPETQSTCAAGTQLLTKGPENTVVVNQKAIASFINLSFLQVGKFYVQATTSVSPYSPTDCRLIQVKAKTLKNLAISIVPNPIKDKVTIRENLNFKVKVTEGNGAVLVNDPIQITVYLVKNTNHCMISGATNQQEFVNGTVGTQELSANGYADFANNELKIKTASPSPYYLCAVSALTTEYNAAMAVSTLMLAFEHDGTLKLEQYPTSDLTPGQSFNAKAKIKNNNGLGVANIPTTLSIHEGTTCTGQLVADANRNTETKNSDGSGYIDYLALKLLKAGDFSLKVSATNYKSDCQAVKVKKGTANLSLTAPATFSVGVPITDVFSVLTDGSSNGIANQNITLSLYSQSGCTGTAQSSFGPIASGPNGRSDFSSLITITSPGQYSIKANYPGSGVYDQKESSCHNFNGQARDLSLAFTTRAQVNPSEVNVNQDFTIETLLKVGSEFLPGKDVQLSIYSDMNKCETSTDLLSNTLSGQTTISSSASGVSTFTNLKISPQSTYWLQAKVAQSPEFNEIKICKKIEVKKFQLTLSLTGPVESFVGDENDYVAKIATQSTSTISLENLEIKLSLAPADACPTTIGNASQHSYLEGAELTARTSSQGGEFRADFTNIKINKAEKFSVVAIYEGSDVFDQKISCHQVNVSKKSTSMSFAVNPTSIEVNKNFQTLLASVDLGGDLIEGKVGLTLHASSDTNCVKAPVTGLDADTPLVQGILERDLDQNSEADFKLDQTRIARVGTFHLKATYLGTNTFAQNSKCEKIIVRDPPPNTLSFDPVPVVRDEVMDDFNINLNHGSSNSSQDGIPVTVRGYYNSSCSSPIAASQFSGTLVSNSVNSSSSFTNINYTGQSRFIYIQASAPDFENSVCQRIGVQETYRACEIAGLGSTYNSYNGSFETYDLSPPLSIQHTTRASNVTEGLEHKLDVINNNGEFDYRTSEYINYSMNNVKVYETLTGVSTNGDPNQASIAFRTFHDVIVKYKLQGQSEKVILVQEHFVDKHVKYQKDNPTCSGPTCRFSKKITSYLGHWGTAHLSDTEGVNKGGYSFYGSLQGVITYHEAPGSSRNKSVTINDCNFEKFEVITRTGSRTSHSHDLTQNIVKTPAQSIHFTFQNDQ